MPQMGNKEKRCDGCLKDRVIWKNYLDEDGVRRRYCKLCAGVLMKVRKKPKPTVRKTLRTRSLKRQKQEKEYSVRRKIFLENNPVCQIAISGVCTYHSTEIHHVNDRNGDKLNDETFWKATDRACNQWVHAHPKEARELGFLI